MNGLSSGKELVYLTEEPMTKLTLLTRMWLMQVICVLDQLREC